MLTTLDRYVLGKILKTFVPMVFGLCFLFFLAASYSLLRKEELSLAQVALAIPWVIPFLIPYLVPMAFMISLALVYGRLVADNEVLAFGSLGIPSRDLGWVSLALGLVLSLGSAWCTAQLLPYSHQKKGEALRAVFRQLFDLGRGQHWSRTFPKQGFDLYVQDYEPGRLSGIVIHYVLQRDELSGGEGLATQLVARSGSVEPDPDPTEEGEGLILVLEDVTVTLQLQRTPLDESNMDSLPTPSAIHQALTPEERAALAARQPVRIFFERYVQKISLGGVRRIKPTDRSSPDLLAAGARDRERVRLAALTGGLATLRQAKETVALEAEVELGLRAVLSLASFLIALVVVPLTFVLRAETPLIPFGAGVLAAGGVVFAPLLLGKSLAEASGVPELVYLGGVVPLGVGAALNLWANRI